MRRLLLALIAAAFTIGFIAPRQASAQQYINFYVGAFTPRSEDARGTDDVLFANGDFLTFDFKEFNGPIFGAEWLVELGDFLQTGIGVGFYQRTSPAVYTRFVNRTGAEIEQDLKLRIVPITATVRVLPLGNRGPVRPYVGGGVGIFLWRYSESGEFYDSFDGTIFRDSFVEKHANAGPVVLGGVMIPVGQAGFGFEARYQAAKGNLPKPPEGFAGPKLDLGGMNYLFTVNFQF